MFSLGTLADNVKREIEQQYFICPKIFQIMTFRCDMTSSNFFTQILA